MTDHANLLAEIDLLGEKLAQAKASITRQFIGQEDSVELALATLLCGGHALLVGLPGLGKTKLVETLAVVMGLDGKRVQFTPDLMPADILGSEVLDHDNDGRRSFRFLPGPIFTQLLMADEINRASPASHAGIQGNHSRRRSPTCSSVSRAGHTKSDRTGRHLSPAGSATRPVLGSDQHALSRPGNRAWDFAGHNRA